ncbi:hypothetical protein O6P43_008707 [Quillaja saponaria]|uniref:Uncharacterized protein n=1 Tax=Quillaja saponaria TaxID=32244 RepID=A0AAD7M5T4_QUISA|nr:hypothetical protein O6P43_008707 [Quillaja saponaria]
MGAPSVSNSFKVHQLVAEYVQTESGTKGSCDFSGWERRHLNNNSCDCCQLENAYLESGVYLCLNVKSLNLSSSCV